MSTYQPGVRRPIRGPQLDPRDRPDPQQVAEQRRLANPKKETRK